MYPAKFDYYRAGSVAEAVALLQQHSDAKVLAGGHSLIPAMKLRLATPPALVDIGNVAELKGMGMSNGAVRVGAMTTYAEVARATKDHALHDCCAHVGDAQVRNRGTLGGSLAHNDPAGDMPAVALALEATIEVAGPGGVRHIPANEFLTGLFETALGDAEILTAIHFPAGEGGSAYEKVANPASGYAVAGVAAAVTVSGGVITKCRVALTGATDHARRLPAVENALEGKEATEDNINAAAADAGNRLEFNSDIHADADYRVHLTRSLVAKALMVALSRA